MGFIISQLLERRSQENAETEYLELQILEQNKTVQAFVAGTYMHINKSNQQSILTVSC